MTKAKDPREALRAELLAQGAFDELRFHIASRMERLRASAPVTQAQLARIVDDAMTKFFGEQAP